MLIQPKMTDEMIVKLAVSAAETVAKQAIALNFDSLASSKLFRETYEGVKATLRATYIDTSATPAEEMPTS